MEYDNSFGFSFQAGLDYNLNDKWNKCEVIVMGNNYTIHKLNGKIVNMATKLPFSEGIIGFQSETAEIFYKNIEIKEFDEIIPMEKFMAFFIFLCGLI